MRQGTAALIGGGVCAVALVGILVLAAVRTPVGGVACPAIGVVITVEVVVTGDASAVHDVRLCTTGGCSSAAAAPATSATAPATSATAPATSATASASQPSASTTPDSAPPGDAAAPDSTDPETRLPALPTGPESPPPIAPAGAEHFASPQFFDFGSATPEKWTFDTLGDFPTVVSATAYGVDGRRVATRVVHLEWHRRHPGDVCDASKETGAVTLDVAS